MKIKDTLNEHYKCREFVLLCDCQASQVTFGNKFVWTMKKGEKMLYDFVHEVNESFIFVQSGLNYYVLETKAVPIEP